jgi:hypothetical protein
VQPSQQDRQESGFVRVLDPSDRWLNPASDADRAHNFRGKEEWDISVAMEARCRADRVVACLYGARREVALDRPAYFRFTEPEVEGVGGELKDTDAKPPWPKDYNDAHHDIVKERDKVADQMARFFSEDPGRVSEVSEHLVLCEIASLLAESDAHEKFQKGASYRFRRMYEDGGDERQRWIGVAREHRVLLNNTTVLADLRKMFQNKARRDEWTALMDDLEISDADRANYR